jgi:hypothetical protein
MSDETPPFADRLFARMRDVYEMIETSQRDDVAKAAMYGTFDALTGRAEAQNTPPELHAAYRRAYLIAKYYIAAIREAYAGDPDGMIDGMRRALEHEEGDGSC